MSSLNKVILIGRVGRDAEYKETANGASLCKFSVATSEKYNGQEKTEWHNIVVWGKSAKVCGQYVKKGMLVSVDGQISSNKYTDKNGNERTSYEIKTFSVTFLSKPQGQPQQQQPVQQQMGGINTQQQQQQQGGFFPNQSKNPYDDVPF